MMTLKRLMDHSSGSVSPFTLSPVSFSLLSLSSLPPPSLQLGCATTSSFAAKMAACASTTSAAAVPRPTRVCCVRSLAVSLSWGAVGGRTQARPPWRLHPPPGCCCWCCWAPRCWGRPPAEETRPWWEGWIPHCLHLYLPTCPLPPDYHQTEHELWTGLNRASPPLLDSTDTRWPNGNVQTKSAKTLFNLKNISNTKKHILLKMRYY